MGALTVSLKEWKMWREAGTASQRMQVGLEDAQRVHEKSTEAEYS